MSVPQVQLTARDHYVGKGIPFHGAVALTSVLYYESRLNPGSQGYQSTETPGVLNPHGAYGIPSLNGPRQKDLLDYATAHGLPVGNLITQLDFVLTEIANSYPSSWSAIRSAASYRAIIPILVDEYENPKDKLKEINGALAIAAPLAALPPPSAPAPIPQAPAPVPQAPPATTPAPLPGLPTISATTAGRRAAEQAHFTSLRDQLLAERASIDEEIAVLDQVVAAFGKLNPTPAPIPLPPPQQAPQQGNNSMNPITTSPYTSAAGVGALLNATFSIFQSITTKTPIDPTEAQVIIMSAMSGLGLLFSKDWNTSGGVNK